MRNLRLPLLLLAQALLGWWPTRAGYWVADGVGTVVSWLALSYRRTACRNQARALGPGARPAQVRRSVGAVFRGAARNYFDLIHFRHLGAKELDARLRIHGWDNLAQGLAAGRGVVIATAHLGNPELAIQGVARRGVPVTVLSEPLEPPVLFRTVTRWRQTQGLEFVPTGVAGLKQALRRLQEGGVVPVACDRDLQGAGVWLPFLGEPARIPTGAAALALKTGAALLPAFCARTGSTGLDIFIEPPVETAGEGSFEERVLAATEALLRVMEGYVRRYPDQWYVLAPIWPTPAEAAAEGAVAQEAAATPP